MSAMPQELDFEAPAAQGEDFSIPRAWAAREHAEHRLTGGSKNKIGGSGSLALEEPPRSQDLSKHPAALRASDSPVRIGSRSAKLQSVPAWPSSSRSRGLSDARCERRLLEYQRSDTALLRAQMAARHALTRRHDVDEDDEDRAGYESCESSGNEDLYGFAPERPKRKPLNSDAHPYYHSPHYRGYNHYDHFAEYQQAEFQHHARVDRMAAPWMTDPATAAYAAMADEYRQAYMRSVQPPQPQPQPITIPYGSVLRPTGDGGFLLDLPQGPTERSMADSVAMRLGTSPPPASAGHGGFLSTPPPSVAEPAEAPPGAAVAAPLAAGPQRGSTPIGAAPPPQGATAQSKLKSGQEDKWGRKPSDPVTTLMLRNIPQKISRDKLIEDLANRGMAKSYDFLYLPIDFTTTSSLGYAFINFHTESDMQAFSAVYDGLKLSEDSPKVCSICEAKVQGRAKNVAFYRDSTVMGMEEKYHPVLMNDGVRIPFPKPTRPLGEVQRRPTRGHGGLRTTQ